MIRVTTNGVLRGYKSSLMRAANNRNAAQNKVLTQRNFNSYAEDPAAATQAFQLRRAYWQTSSQINNSEHTIGKFNQAWKTLSSIKTDLADVASSSVLSGLNDAQGAGRTALGAQLKELANSMVQSLNSKYGEDFVFSGAQGGEVPFTWGTNGELLYRGVDVNAKVGTADYDKLQAMLKETVPVDLGLGLKEDGKGNLIGSSVFDAALSGLTFLGHGTTPDSIGNEMPNNIAAITKELGEILSRCDGSTGGGEGSWDSEDDRVRANDLSTHLKKQISSFTSEYVQMDTKATFLETNQTRLKDSAAMLNEQLLSIEQIDLADAITGFSWAQYCYNAALKVGNSILSESLIDYMR